MAPKPRRRWMLILRGVALAIGIAAFAWMANKLGWKGLTKVLVDTGWWFVVIVAIDIGSALFDAAAIVCFSRKNGRVPYARALAAQLSGVAINRVTPGNALGEPVKVSLLEERIPRACAVSTILMFDVGATIVAVTVMVIGVPITLLFADLPSNLVVAAWIAAGVLVGFLVAIFILLRRGLLASGVGTLRRMRIISLERSKRWREGVKKIDDMVRELGATPASRVGLSCLVGSRVLNWVATVVMLYAAGLPVSVPIVIGILSVGALITWISHIVPLGIGIQEGGNYLMYKSFGYSGLTGVDFTTVYRARTCLLAAVGLSVLAITSYADRRRRDTVIV